MNGFAIALGQFDGVHKGHQALIKAAIAQANSLGLSSSAMLFDPLPRAVLFDGFKPLQMHRERMSCMLSLGLNYIHEIKVDQAFIRKKPEDFIQLLQRLSVQAIIVGDDFRFGYKRAGDIELLARYFQVTVVPELAINGRRVSSTWCRELIQAYDFDGYRQLVGRSWRASVEFLQGRAAKLPDILLPIGYEGQVSLGSESSIINCFANISSNDISLDLAISGKADMIIN